MQKNKDFTLMLKNYTGIFNVKKILRNIPLFCFFCFLFLMPFVQSAYCDPFVIEMEHVNNLIQGIFQKVNHARRYDGHEYMYKCATPIIYYALKNKELLWPENRFILSLSFVSVFPPLFSKAVYFAVTPFFFQ